MKISAISAALGAAFVLAGCNGMSGGPDGTYDPLTPPGSGNGVSVVQPTAGVGAGYRPGDFVEAAMDNASFFAQRPQGNADATKLLPGRTPMKVIQADGSYLQVELDSGEVGYVPAIMVTDRAAATSAAVQVYPPVDGTSTADSAQDSLEVPEVVPTGIAEELPPMDMMPPLAPGIE